VNALITEIGHLPANLAERPLVSVFMGGGTPSLFPPAQLARLLSAVAEHLHLGSEAEVTLEANPGALEHAAFAGYLEAGINRLSLGVQSFADDKLKALGRVHDASDALAAYSEARAAGFDNINLDLMYALPDQSVAEAMADVEQLTELAPEHISYYHLTLEPNTVFYARPPALPDAEQAWDIQAGGAEILNKAGYSNYEVSAWGKSDNYSLHNLNYWNFGDYIGLGAGAHGKLTGSAGGIIRQARVAHPVEYLRKVEAGEIAYVQNAVGSADAVFEFMLNVLRLRAGFSVRQFERTTGLSGRLLAGGLAQAETAGLLRADADDSFVPTARGWRFLDDLQAIFLPESGT
jgi:oxygen-independent coproporphyrinogen-3 oxidase